MNFIDAGLLAQARGLDPKPESLFDLACWHLAFVENVRKAGLIKALIVDELGIEVPPVRFSVYSGLSHDEIIHILRKYGVTGPNVLDRLCNGLYHYCLRDKRYGDGAFWDRIYMELEWVRTTPWKSVETVDDLISLLATLPDFSDRQAYSSCKESIRKAGLYRRLGAAVVQPLLDAKKTYPSAKRGNAIYGLSSGAGSTRMRFDGYLEVLEAFRANGWRRSDVSDDYAFLKENLSALEYEAFLLMVNSHRGNLAHQTRELSHDLLMTVVRMFGLHRLSPAELDREHPGLAGRMQSQHGAAFWLFLFEEWQLDLNLVPRHTPHVWPSARLEAACAQNLAQNLPTTVDAPSVWELAAQINARIVAGATRVSLAEEMKVHRKVIEDLRSLIDLPSRLRFFLEEEVKADSKLARKAGEEFRRLRRSGAPIEAAAEGTIRFVGELVSREAGGQVVELGPPTQDTHLPPAR